MARRRRQRRHGLRREGKHAEQEMNNPASPPCSPHFFKIILSHTLETGKLGIPKSFLRRYGKDLSGSVVLKVPGGSTWPVKLEKSSSDMVWLWEGWRKFMEHYSIDHGHLLVFKYEADSIFHVIIFDKSALEIDYPLRIESDVLSPEGIFLSQKEENVREIEYLEGVMSCSLPSSNSLSQEFGVPRPLTALQLASRFKSDYPFFKVVMRPSYVQQSMSIPREFFRKHVQKNKQIATLRCSDRSWWVKLWSHEPRDVASLSIGWSLFVRETGLRVRDVCVFELIDGDNIVFRVSIFSCHGQVQIKQSQCQECSAEPDFHSPPFLMPDTAHENANKFESDHPFFRVVILQSHMNRYLRIPCKFFRENVQKNKQIVTLRYSDRSWWVKLRRQPNDIASLSIGWSLFVRETGLCPRDVCVFELIDRDNIVFKVSIFSSDGQVQIKQSQCQENSSAPAFHGSLCLNRITAYENANKFESDHPLFKVVILPRHIINRYLNIPWEFIRTYLRGNLRKVTLVYSGRSWEVKVWAYPHSHTAFLAVGWSAFAREACLREGDVCVFKLVDKDNVVFGVSIFGKTEEK